MRVNGPKLQNQTRAQLEERRANLFADTGRMQFHKQILEAQLIQANQEINSINEHFSKLGDGPQAVPSPSEAHVAAPETEDGLPPGPSVEDLAHPRGI